MSSDEVGVDPGRVSQAAGALENLRDVLAANVPTIVNTMQEYWNSGAGSPISLAALQQAQSRSPEDATDMRTRAELAAAWLAQSVNLAGSAMVNIPWGNTPATLAELDQLDAQAQAQALSAAEAESGKNPTAARAAITAIQLDIADHTKSGDTSWLTQFYTQAAPAVANLAATLNSEDGQHMVVLSPQDQKILGTYATGLAYADKNGTLSQTTINAFSQSKNLWSVGMLFKFGPPGSAYGTQENLGKDSDGNTVTQPNLLAQVTTAIELARMRGGFTIPLTGSDVPLGSPGSAYVQQLMAEFDPAPAMLTLSTQNGAAAREVLAGPDGKQIASDLMTRPVEFYYATFDGSKLTGFMPIASPKPYFDGEQITQDSDPLNWQDHQVTYSPSVIGSFLDTAANSAPRGSGPAAFNSAQAALNLIEATPSPTGEDGIHLPEPVRQALLHTAQNYMLDLAYSSTNTGTTSIVEGPQAGLPVYHLLLPGQGKDNPLSTYLQQISYDKGDVATLDASAKVTFSNIYAATELGKLPPGFNGAAANNAMAGLLGRIQTEANNVGVHLATDSDEQHEEYNKIIDLGESVLPLLPGIGDVADSATDPAKAFLGLLGIPTSFSTSAATATEQADAQSFAVQGIQIHVAMVQGLMSNGASDLLSNAQQFNSTQPKSLQWLQGNQVVLTPQNYSGFQDWYETLNPKIDQKYGLSSLESRYGYYYNQQGSTSSDGAFGPW
jgi:hypothetical protein